MHILPWDEISSRVRTGDIAVNFARPVDLQVQFGVADLGRAAATVLPPRVVGTALSLGQRMRGELAASLVHSPELILLDEPTVGLDVLSKERLRAVLRSEQHGRTLLLTTHDMDDVERLCRSPEVTTAAAVLDDVSRLRAVRDLSIEEPQIEDVVRRLYLAAG